jgi:hypothetical protein
MGLLAADLFFHAGTEGLLDLADLLQAATDNRDVIW